MEVSITPAEMIEVYKSAPGIVVEFKQAMRRDKRNARMAKRQKEGQ